MDITPEEYERQVEALRKALQARTAIYVNTPEEISRVRAVVTTWFRTLRPRLEAAGVTASNLEFVDQVARQCMELTLQRSKRKKCLSTIAKLSKTFKKQIVVLIHTQTFKEGAASLAAPTDIIERLRRLSPGLATSYQQIYVDVGGAARLSYRGTANEIREVLRETMDRLAPDEEVMARPWYKHEGDRTQPTQRQKARYILERRSAASAQLAVATEAIRIVENGLSQLAREMYTRTSAAAHTSADIAEIQRVLRYFEALIVDLCEPPPVA